MANSLKETMNTMRETDVVGYEIQSHNVKPAGMWNAGGDDYDAISASISDAIEHCMERVAPRPLERVLDVATGTGWAARLAASVGAHVTGVDIADELLAAADRKTRDAGLDVDYRIGDAEALPFADACFDAVVSTFGVMFVRRPEAAAREMARVCRPGGRVALTAWTPDSTIAGYFEVFKRYMPEQPAPPPPSPFAWGSRERMCELMGHAFDLRFETGCSMMRVPDEEAAWMLFVTGYGPVKALWKSLDPERRARLKQDFCDFHPPFRTELGVALPREYMVAVGTRR
jgi:SAM-dependent methyltransferase